MIMLCPHCWQQVDRNAAVCLQCGGDLSSDARDYLEKVITSLHHPDALTQRRAAYLLGLIGDARAVPVLIDVLHDNGFDPFVRAQAAESLGILGGPSAQPELQAAASNPAESVIVRASARTALATLSNNENHTDAQSSNEGDHHAATVER